MLQHLTSITLWFQALTLVQFFQCWWKEHNSWDVKSLEWAQSKLRAFLTLAILRSLHIAVSLSPWKIETCLGRLMMCTVCHLQYLQYWALRLCVFKKKTISHDVSSHVEAFWSSFSMFLINQRSKPAPKPMGNGGAVEPWHSENWDNWEILGSQKGKVPNEDDRVCGVVLSFYFRCWASDARWKNPVYINGKKTHLGVPEK